MHRKNTNEINFKVIKTKNTRLQLKSQCSICKNKKSRFMSKGSGLFDSVGLNTPQNRMKNAFFNTFKL